MIVYTLVQLRDLGADAYTYPQAVPSLGAYLRQISDEVNTAPQQGEKPGILFLHSQQFEIFELGTWTDTTGKFEFYEEKISHGLASNYLMKRS